MSVKLFTVAVLSWFVVVLALMTGFGQPVGRLRDANGNPMQKIEQQLPKKPPTSGIIDNLDYICFEHCTRLC